MAKQYNVACIVGTRPEVIKMAPIVYELRRHSIITTTLISTGQHREMLDSMLKIFDLEPDVDLHLMKHNQTLSNLTGEACIHLEPILKNKKYDLVLAQGDTTTTFVAALTAFYLKIPFGHVEAGLRSRNIHEPFPEEMNRVVASLIATLHFAPTEEEKANLLKENLPEKNIFVTGNTAIDALCYVRNKKINIPFSLPENKRLILTTVHHRENFGDGLENICLAILKLAETISDIFFIIPVHPNPNVKRVTQKMLGHHPSILLTEPLNYDVFVALMEKSYLIMTDSGGIEEEAPALCKPLIVLRSITERPKVISLGLGKLVGNNTGSIVNTTLEVLNNPEIYNSMIKNISPYGDGKTAKRIVDIIMDEWEKSE